MNFGEYLADCKYENKKKNGPEIFRTVLAVRTGLEPATPGVTGRYSNQLNYRTICSVLCVFLERGCKDTQKIPFSKFLLRKMGFFK